MTTFVASLLMSLDARDANDVKVPDAEEHEEFNRLFGDADLLLCDRANYDLLVPAWDHLDISDPGMDPIEREFAEVFRTKRRLVLAPDLESVDDPLAELVQTDLMARVAALREQDAGNVLICADSELLSALFEHRLVDEVHVVLRPCLIGGPSALLGDLLRLVPLDLTASRSVASGSLILRYRVGEAAEGQG